MVTVTVGVKATACTGQILTEHLRTAGHNHWHVRRSLPQNGQPYNTSTRTVFSDEAFLLRPLRPIVLAKNQASRSSQLYSSNLQEMESQMLACPAWQDAASSKHLWQRNGTYTISRIPPLSIFALRAPDMRKPVSHSSQVQAEAPGYAAAGR